MVMRTRLGRGAEFDLIRRFLRTVDSAPLPEGVVIGPGDDCVVLGAQDLALSVDMSIEEIHFRRDWLTPEEIGYRATAAALSDLAAMAATPLGILVALAVHPQDTALAARVMDGAQAAAAAADAALLGGDTTRSPGPVIIDVVVAGVAARPATRRGARPGDEIWVTGALGAAASAVRAWSVGGNPDPAARAAFARPQPRIREAIWLADAGIIRALIDLSDGLAGDAGHLAAASGVQIVLDAACVPVHPAVLDPAAGVDQARALSLALRGGEDYELCFAAAPRQVEPLQDRFAARFGVQLTRVGAVHDGTGVMLRRDDGVVEELDSGGFDHFGASA